MARVRLPVDIEALKDALYHSPTSLDHDKAILAAAGVVPWFPSESQDQPEATPSKAEELLKG